VGGRGDPTRVAVARRASSGRRGRREQHVHAGSPRVLVAAGTRAPASTP